MTTTIGPCLAFCTRHIDEVETLLELDDAKKLTESADLLRFREVYARATLEASRLVARCLGVAKAALSDAPIELDPKGASKPDWESEAWEAYQHFSHADCPERAASAFFGVCLQTARGRVWFTVYVGEDDAKGQAVAALDEWLRDRCPRMDPAVPWAAEEVPNAVLLRVRPIDTNALPEELVELCREAMVEVAPHLTRVAELAPKK